MPRLFPLFTAAFVLSVFATDSSARSPKVPAPYTAVEAKSSSFRCLGRKTELGSLLLPAQIVAAEKPLLADPIRIVSEPNVFTALRGKTMVKKTDDGGAVWEWTADSKELSAHVTMSADCDGFCWYDIQLRPHDVTTLKALYLEVPRTTNTARYLHTSSYDWSNVSQGLPELGGRWAGAFMPYIWLGDEDRGLAWCAESSEGWKLAQPGRALVIETTGSNVVLRANFIDHEEKMTPSDVLRYRFGFQASPVKPVSFGWRAKARILHDIHYDSCVPGADGKCELDKIRDGGAKTVVIHDSWTKYFGQMVPADAKRFKELINACHQRGLKLLVYVGYGVARTAPELQGKHDNWSVIPIIPWDPSYKPETRAFDATCARSAWADWLVEGTDRLFAEFDLDGLYFDGTSAAWRCQNQAHGCGWKDAQGNVHPDYPMLAARKLMRRIADTVHRHRKDTILDVHMSSNLTLPTLSFDDSLWNGEQFEGHTSAEKFSVPLHAFRTEFMGYAHGMDVEFLCYENRPFTFDEAITLAWLHGIEVRPYPQNLSHVTPLWKAMDSFGTTKAKWLPYWKDSGATAKEDAIKASSWIRDGKALLFISHFERKPAATRLTLDAKRLGLRGHAWMARDALSGEAVVIDDNKLDVAFTGMNFRLIEITPKN